MDNLAYTASGKFLRFSSTAPSVPIRARALDSKKSPSSVSVSVSCPSPSMEPEPQRLFASIDVGTSSFKLLIAAQTPANSSPRFLPLDRLTSPVLLGRSLPSSKSLPPSSISRSLSALRSFSHLLSSLSLPVTSPLLIRAVATSALRSAPNRAHLLSLARSRLDLDIEVLSGADEARLIYLGVLHFLPVLHRRVLAVDIGGGSTEFVLGFQGQILFSASLDLGHVTLTESFGERFADLRSHVRTALKESGLVGKVRQLGFEVAVGSSGTVKSIEKAISGLDFRRKWRFCREELRSLEERICGSFEMLGLEGVKRLGFSKRKSEFIAAGAILLREIFDALGIEEMDVSGYALGEGVIAEMMMKEKSSSGVEFGLDLNERWSSVVRLAVRFDCRNWMKLAVQCVGIAKDIFYGIRGCGVMGEDQNRSLVFLEEKDYEYLEASILLHNIGRVNGKKGYHKLSYQIIKHGGHLEGYSPEEIELIAQLVRFHRKKFPKCENASIQKFPLEMKDKFRVLCTIIRLSLNIQRCQHRTSQGVEVVHTPQGFKLVLGGIKEQCVDPCGVQWSSPTADEELRLELQHFEEVYHESPLFFYFSLAKEISLALERYYKIASCVINFKRSYEPLSKWSCASEVCPFDGVMIMVYGGVTEQWIDLCRVQCT